MQKAWPWAVRLLRPRREPETYWTIPSTGVCPKEISIQFLTRGADEPKYFPSDV